MFNRKRRSNRGVTLIELLVAMAILAGLMFTTSLIYFSCLKIYQASIWKLPPYDEATLAVREISRHIRGSMLIDSFSDDWLIVVQPQKDANRDNVLAESDGALSLVAGDKVAFYLSDDSGSLVATGNTLWMAIQPGGAGEFVPRKKIAANIHPELNPDDPDTGAPRPMFRYWPDETRLWGVEMWITSTAQVHGEVRFQTEYSEVYLRNL